MTRRPVMTRLALTAAFLVVPLLEVFGIIAVGRVVGGWPTLGLLLAMSVLGTYLVRREGAAAWRHLRTALEAGRIPSHELADAALVLVGGTLLLTPGFFTDLLGFALLLPLTRPVARRALTRFLAQRLTGFAAAGLAGSGAPRGTQGPYGARGARTTSAGGSRRTGTGGGDWPGGPSTGAGSGRVVPGEVIPEAAGPEGPQGAGGAPPRR